MKVLHKRVSTLSTLKASWKEIVQEVGLTDKLSPNKFVQGKLFLATKLPIIYIVHLKEIIKLKCNQVLTAHLIKEIVFIKASIDID